MKLTLLALLFTTALCAQQPTPKKYSVVLYDQQWDAFFNIITRLKDNAGNPDLKTRDLSDLHRDADSLQAIFFRQLKPQVDSANSVNDSTIKKPVKK